MRYKLFAFLLFLTVLSLLILSNENSVEAQSAHSDNYQHLLNKAKLKGTVPVIVRLKTNFTPEGYLKSKEILNQRRKISLAASNVLSRLPKKNLKNIMQSKYLPYFAIEADAKTLSILKKNSSVETIDEDKLVKPALEQSIPLINADDAWSSSYTGAGWTIAILDTGVSKNHSFLTNKVVAEACFSSTSTYHFSKSLCPNGGDIQTGPGAGIPCDENLINGCDHGTHVAGIAAGEAAAFNGVAKEANLISIQIYSRFPCSNGTSYCVAAWTSDLISALMHVYSLRNDFKIASVNLSLAGIDVYNGYCDQYNKSVKSALDTLASVGIATIIATGNDGFSTAVSEPGCISSAVSVGATTKTDERASFTNYSQNVRSLLAPGTDIISSINSGGFKSESGTSMATPHVAGAWALMRHKYPTASISDIFSAFWYSGVMVALANGYQLPRIDVNAALNGTFLLPPSAPQSFFTTAITTDSIGLSWVDTSTNETGFQIVKFPYITNRTSYITLAADVTSYAEKNLLPNTDYIYQVRAFNTAGFSDFSNIIYTRTKKLPPTIPTDLTALSVSQSKITLSWKDNSNDELGFKLERKLGGCLSTNPWVEKVIIGYNAETTSDSSLAANTLYSYRIKAYNNAASSSYSNCSTAKTGIAGTPQSPTNVRAVSAGTNTVHVLWLDNSTNETIFRIYKKQNSAGWLSLSKQSSNTNRFTDLNALSNSSRNTFSYYVIACNAKGCSPRSAIAVVPYKPADLSVKPLSLQIDLGWRDISNNETGFRIERKRGSCVSSSSWSVIRYVDANATFYADNGLDPRTTYSYRVSALNRSQQTPFAFGFSMITPCRSATTP